MTLKCRQKWEIKAFSSLFWAREQPCFYAWLSDHPEHVRAFQSLQWHLIPQVFLFKFSQPAYLPSLVSLSQEALKLNNCSWLFSTSTLKRSLFLLNQLLNWSNKDKCWKRSFSMELSDRWKWQFSGCITLRELQTYSAPAVTARLLLPYILCWKHSCFSRLPIDLKNGWYK